MQSQLFECGIMPVGIKSFYTNFRKLFMHILYLALHLGVVAMVFRFIWRWIITLPAEILFSIVPFNIGMRLVNISQYYFLTSLLAMLTILSLGENPSKFVLVSYCFIGICVLFVGYASDLYDAQKEAQSCFDRKMEEQIEKDASFGKFLLLGAFIFYILALLVPSILSNNVTDLLLTIVTWLKTPPILWWFIGIIVVVFLIAIFFQGLYVYGTVRRMFIEKIRGSQALEFSEE